MSGANKKQDLWQKNLLKWRDKMALISDDRGVRIADTIIEELSDKVEIRPEMSYYKVYFNDKYIGTGVDEKEVKNIIKGL